MSTSDTYARASRRSAELEAAIASDPSPFRVLTGDRPTGALHLGHYFGTLQNRVRLQDIGVQVMLIIADYQVIADRDDVTGLRASVLDLLADYLAAGIDPTRSSIFTHSSVPALNQLLLPFLSLVSVAELERNPTVKAEIEATGGRTVSGLQITYPVHQAADILFCCANLVPVGRDQLPHLELTRDVARRFNQRYRPQRALFPEPEALLSAVPTLLGLDGHKMSKSRGNAIALGDDEDRTAQLIRRATTDSQRHITYEPQRRPEVANLLDIASLCTGIPAPDLADQIGSAGSQALKSLVTEAVNEYFRSLRQRRKDLAADPEQLLSVLSSGNHTANQLAHQTLDDVRDAMLMTY